MSNCLKASIQSFAAICSETIFRVTGRVGIGSCVSYPLGYDHQEGRILLSTIPEDYSGMNEQSGTDNYSGGIRQVLQSRTSSNEVPSLVGIGAVNLRMYSREKKSRGHPAQQDL